MCFYIILHVFQHGVVALSFCAQMVVVVQREIFAPCLKIINI